MKESAQRSECETHRKTRGEKMLSTLATLAVVALVLGISSVYLSTNTTTLVADNNIQPAPITSQESDFSSPGPVIRRTIPPVAVLPDIEPAENPAAPLPAEQPGSNTNSMQPATIDIETAGVNHKDIAALPPAVEILRADNGQDVAETPPAIETVSVDSVKDITDTLPAPAAGTPATVSLLTSPGGTNPPNTTDSAAVTSDGIWVVNIASYTYESRARRKLEEFRKKGVVAEVFAATVNDRPIYRIRATGYASYADAKTWVSLLEDRLSVDSAWVSKR